jgi:UDP:flavonoid glycosyltransferase YjiC (YdhE family)
MSSSRILFTCRPLSGHFDPLIPLAEAARAAGHEIGFASGEPVAGRARDAGFLAFEAGPPDSFRAEWAPRFPHFTTLVGDAQREFFFAEIFANLELAPRAVDLESIMSSWRPHLVVHEMAELAAPLVSTSLGIPYVDVGFGPLIPRALLTSAGTAAARHWRARGLEPHPLAGLLRYLYIDPCPPALQNQEIADLDVVQQMRPTVADEHVGGRPPWLRDLPHDHTVYLTLGTIWNTDIDLFRLVIEALRDRVNLIVTVGRQNQPEVFGPQPAGVIIRSYIPQHELLPWCDAAVVHGGSGTMLGALAHGLPVLVLPQGADQWNNAERVTTAGAGRRLLRHDVTSDTIRDGITAMLREPSYRRAATRVQDQIRAMPSVREAISRIERLIAFSGGD